MNSTLRLGLVFLILSNLVGFIGRRVETDIDFVTGLLSGVTFALLLLSIRWSRNDSTMARC